MAWRLDLPITTPISMNDRMHWSQRARAVAELRQATFWLVREAKVPRLGRVRTTLFYAPRDRRRRDPINLMATLKPVQDGLVDAGVVPDDTPEYMETTVPRIETPTGRVGKLWVEVEEIR